jgi:hypothetical protein
LHHEREGLLSGHAEVITEWQPFTHIHKVDTSSVLNAACSTFNNIPHASMIHPIADNNDPDPTSQIPWPGRSRTQEEDELAEVDDVVPSNIIRKVSTPQEKRFFSTWDLITLSISMAGAQIAWTVELGLVLTSGWFLDQR